MRENNMSRKFEYNAGFVEALLDGAGFEKSEINDHTVTFTTETENVACTPMTISVQCVYDSIKLVATLTEGNKQYVSEVFTTTEDLMENKDAIRTPKVWWDCFGTNVVEKDNN